MRAKSKFKRRFGKCGERCPGYDDGDGRRRWRGLNLGVVKVWLEARGAAALDVTFTANWRGCVVEYEISLDDRLIVWRLRQVGGESNKA